MKKILISSIVTSMLLTSQAQAVLGVGDITFDVTQLPATIGDIITKNIQDASQQYMESTIQNGMSAAGNSLQNCLDFDFGDIMSNLGGVEIELPCGAVWSVDNPIDAVYNQVASELVGSFKSYVTSTTNSFLGQVFSKETWYCKNLNLDLNWKYDQGDILDARIKNRMERWNSEPNCSNTTKEKEDGQNPLAENDKPQNQLSSDIKNDIKDDGVILPLNTNKPKGYINKIVKENDNLVKNLIANSEAANTYTVYSPTFFNYEDILFGDQEALALRKELTGAKTLSEDEKKALEEKAKNFYHNKSKIPIPILSSFKNNSTGEENQLWKEDWGKNSPATQIVYTSPFEIFDKFEGKGGKEIKNTIYKDLKNNQNIMYGDDKEITVQESIKNGKQISSNDVKNEYLKAFNQTLGKDNGKFKTVNEFTHSKSHQLLNQTTNLLVGSVNNAGSQSGNALIEMLRLEQLANGQHIQTDALTKIIEILTKENLNNTNAKNTEYLGSINKRINEQNMMINKSLKLQEETNYLLREMLKQLSK